MRQRRVLVVGGGIAGLTLARALVRDGHAVTLLEKSPAWRPLGAGITLAGNATAILDRLGLGAEIRAAGRRIVGGNISDAQGRPIVEVQLDDDAFVALSELWALHRADLHEVLLAGAEGADIRLGSTVASLEETPDGVRACLESGETLDVDVVVGADGIRSRVRALALGAEDPEVRYAGYTTWRVVADNRIGLETGHEMWGRGARVGLVPLKDDRVYAFFVQNAPRGERDPEGADRVAMLRERFASFGGHAAAFLASLDQDAVILRHDIEELPRPVFGRGRITLVGDAAHAMTPNLGQGAAQGIEDALALPLALAATEGDVQALRAYAASRMERARFVQVQSRRIGAVGQWSSALACGLRNALLRSVPSRSALKNVERVIAPGMELARAP